MRILLVFSYIFLLTNAALAQETPFGFYVMEPGEKKELNISSIEKVRVGWRTDMDEDDARSCPEGICMRLKEKDGPSYIESMYGDARLWLPTEEGEINLILENLAPFEITVTVFKESFNIRRYSAGKQ